MKCIRTILPPALAIAVAEMLLPHLFEASAINSWSLAYDEDVPAGTIAAVPEDHARGTLWLAKKPLASGGSLEARRLLMPQRLEDKLTLRQHALIAWSLAERY